MDIGCRVERPTASELSAMFPKYDFTREEGTKPGFQVTPFIRYSSIPSTSSALYPPPAPHTKSFWKCSWCNEFEGVMSSEDMDDHLKECKSYSRVVTIVRAPKVVEA